MEDGPSGRPRGIRSFRAIFVAVLVATALVVSAFILHARRPAGQLEQPTAELVEATGKCAACHRRETPSVVHQFERSDHAATEVNCLDCHRAVEGQEATDHRGFEISLTLTSANCRQCHSEQYDQYLRSRHAAPAWAAVHGEEPFSEEQIAFAEKHHEGAVARPPNLLAHREGRAAMAKGCEQCHGIGKPNDDGSIGTCIDCHSRHTTSVELARTPTTCGQCHMGPDHAQLEIYQESKHGVMYTAMKDEMNLSAPPDELTTADMPTPTCATCHMSGIEGNAVTHDVTERLSYTLFAPISEKRPAYRQGRAEMRGICLECHTKPRVDRFFEEAEDVLVSVNETVGESQSLMDDLREEGLLTPEPFDEPIEYVAFDLWHYFGRTAKHGAFMGGADFVQWHGFYELHAKTIEMREMAEELRAGHGGGGEHAPGEGSEAHDGTGEPSGSAEPSEAADPASGKQAAGGDEGSP